MRWTREHGGFGPARVGRRSLALGALVLVTLLVASAAQAQSGGGCRLTGSAKFTPGLTFVPNSYTYTFQGNLTLCNSAPAAGPASGTASVGTVWTQPGTEFKWQEPIGSAGGGCASSMTAATTIVRWADGTTTIIAYETISVLSAVHLRGTVIDSLTLQAFERQEGQPETLTLSSNRYAGGTVNGLLLATTTNGLNCATSGLTTVPLDGPTTLVVS